MRAIKVPVLGLSVVVASLLLAVWVGGQQPVQAATATVTGTVTSSNGPVREGVVFFYATCQDYNDKKPAAYAWFNSGIFEATVPRGSYRVLVDPRGMEPNAIRSWNNAKSTCAQADAVVVTGSNTTSNLVALSGSKITGTINSANGPLLARCTFTRIARTTRTATKLPMQPPTMAAIKPLCLMAHSAS